MYMCIYVYMYIEEDQPSLLCGHSPPLGYCPSLPPPVPTPRPSCMYISYTGRVICDLLAAQISRGDVHFHTEVEGRGRRYNRGCVRRLACFARVARFPAGLGGLGYVRLFLPFFLPAIYVSSIRDGGMGLDLVQPVGKILTVQVGDNVVGSIIYLGINFSPIFLSTQILPFFYRFLERSICTSWNHQKVLRIL